MSDVENFPDLEKLEQNNVIVDEFGESWVIHGSVMVMEECYACDDEKLCPECMRKYGYDYVL